MLIDRQRVELLQLQYELAMAIGTSLDMRTMLRPALSTFLRKLNCSAGGIFIQRYGVYSTEPEYAIPRNQQGNIDCRSVVQSLVHQGNDPDCASPLERLPLEGGDSVSGYHYIHELPDVGFIALVKQGEPLDLPVVLTLPPLLQKLSSACQACLQNEELARTHHRIEFEHNILRTVISNTPIIIFAIDRDGIFTLSEGHGLVALDRTPGEVVGQSIYDYYSETPQILEAVAIALNGKANFRTIETRGLSFDAYYEPIYDQDGTVNGVVGVAHDITERKDAAETLSTVLDAVGEGILTINSDGEIVMVNPEAEEIFGYPSGGLIGVHLQMLMPAQYREAHQQGMQRYLSTGEAHILGKRIELEGLHRDGHSFPLEFRVQEAILREQSYFTASVRDITLRHEYDRMRDDFVSTVSHELRTPLTSILGWSETLLSGRPGPLTSDQERFLKIIESSSGRLQRLIEEILTVSRVQSGNLRLEVEPFLPRTVFASVREVVDSLLARKSLSLEIEDEWPGVDRVNGDGRRIEQVLTNIVGNAAKFSPDRSAIQLKSTKTEAGWHVEVRDQGIGIAEADLPHIFERFYRAGTAKEAQIQGTGLGLYICKAIVEGHGGTIGLSSEIGKGTTVWFSIPQV
jgi:PAS domain S-box-containing protein